MKQGWHAMPSFAGMGVLCMVCAWPWFVVIGYRLQQSGSDLCTGECRNQAMMDGPCDPTLW
jgi:hypothetical protein